MLDWSRRPQMGLLLIAPERFANIGEGTPRGSYKARKEAESAWMLADAQKIADVTFTGIVWTRKDVQHAIDEFVHAKVDYVLALYLSWAEDFAWIRFLRDMPECPVLFCHRMRDEIDLHDTHDDDEFTEYLCCGGLVGSLEASGSIQRTNRPMITTFAGTWAQVMERSIIFGRAARARAMLRQSTFGWLDLCYGNQLYTEMAREVFGAVGCAPTETSEEREAWRRYVEATVKHFHGRIRWYEIWNEPDGLWCWRKGVDATAYGRFAADTARAIHHADPEAKAIAGVLCYADLPYLRTMLEAGVGETADAISFHRYNAAEQDALRDIDAMRALIDSFNPRIMLIQGESGTQSDSRGAGALRGGAWNELKQAKYLLRHRLIDLHSELVFTSHFSAMDMVEALNGKVGEKSSYLDFGYFGVIQAEFNEDGLATGTYKPKCSYYALQNLCALFSGKVEPCRLPIRRVVEASERVFDRDDSSAELTTFGFRRNDGEALAYWKAADLMRETYEGTVSFELAGTKEKIHLIDLLHGHIYEVPESMLQRRNDYVVRLVNLPLLDTPLLLTIGNFVPMR